MVRHPLPGQCERCHAPLPVDDVQAWERRQVVDIPAISFNVIEHQALAVTCSCGQLHTSSFPLDVSEAVQYGARVRALGVHLTQGQMLPYARVGQLIADIYGLTISPGTLVAWVAEARAALQPTADDIARQLKAAHLVHADESGLRVAGKLHWLHIAANATRTWYGVHGKHGLAAIDEHGILAKRTGVLAGVVARIPSKCGKVRLIFQTLVHYAHKHNDKRRHHIPKMKFKVTNWAEYDASFRRRGRLTLWATDEAMACWQAAPRLTAGGQPCYSNLAIETGLILRLAFHLPLHQTEGLMASVFELMGVSLATPDHSTLSRRAMTTASISKGCRLPD